MPLYLGVVLALQLNLLSIPRFNLDWLLLLCDKTRWLLLHLSFICLLLLLKLLLGKFFSFTQVLFTLLAGLRHLVALYSTWLVILIVVVVLREVDRVD